MGDASHVNEKMLDVVVHTAVAVLIEKESSQEIVQSSREKYPTAVAELLHKVRMAYESLSEPW